MNKKRFGIFRVILLIVLSIFVVGCSRNSAKNMISNEKRNDTTVKTNQKKEQTVKENLECDTSVSSGYYMSLGVLDENFVINGPNRDETEISIVNGKVVFPQGAIRSVSVGSFSRKDEAFNLEKKELDSLIKEIETTKSIVKLPKRVFENMPRIQTKLLYLNSHGEFRTISITSYGEGYHEISVEKDDVENFSKPVKFKVDKGGKKKHVFLQSDEIEKKIKEWISFEKDGECFEKINQAKLFIDEQNTSTQLQDKEIDILKKYVKSRKKTVDTPCGHDNYFKCTLHDGSTFHFSICSDGESLSTDQNIYSIDSSTSSKISDLLKSIRGRIQ